MNSSIDIENFAESCASYYLDDYIKTISINESVVSRKEINDPVWGTISLSPIEVVFLDSPLIQRLRTIKQLGVVHWVYPSAVHTRFEHTLGVIFQVQNLITAINSYSLQKKNQSEPMVDSDYTQLLRLSAMFHDIGHMAFSHVSENSIVELGMMQEFCSEFSIKYKLKDLKFSEILAYFIVRSKSMKSLFSAVISKYGNFISFSTNHNKNIEIIVDKISDSIVGRQIHEEIPQL
jgi:deoxynucleoside triphosphate triphosphohydrolase SAMHD1